MENEMKKYYLSARVSTGVEFDRFSEIYADDRTQTCRRPCPTSGRRVAGGSMDE